MTTPDKPIDVSFSFDLTDNPIPDEKHKDFFAWVGVCIKEWANIEKVLFDVCTFLLKTDRKHVSIIYYRTPSLEGRLALTDDLLRSTFPKKPGEHDNPKLVVWIKILKEIRDLVPARNVLAHSPIRYQMSIVVQAGATAGEDKVTSQESAVEIATSPNEFPKTRIGKSFGVDDLPKQHAAVRAACDRLEEFYRDLKQEQPSKSSEQNTPHPPG